ncbi:MAG: hypothetical protein QOJ82_1273 [Solirubrobacteraceae bacterium]|jgi:hypothetical protein|nr:hypothetical protein [Solirubrobacteraceae bacterium]
MASRAGGGERTKGARPGALQDLLEPARTAGYELTVSLAGADAGDVVEV